MPKWRSCGTPAVADSSTVERLAGQALHGKAMERGDVHEAVSSEGDSLAGGTVSMVARSRRTLRLQPERARTTRWMPVDRPRHGSSLGRALAAPFAVAVLVAAPQSSAATAYFVRAAG